MFCCNKSKNVSNQQKNVKFAKLLFQIQQHSLSYNPGANPPDYNYVEDGTSDCCKELASQCLGYDGILLETFAEVASNMSKKKILEKSAKRAYAVSFTSLERNTEMKQLLVKCVTERNVDQQWYLDHQDRNSHCKNSINASE